MWRAAPPRLPALLLLLLLHALTRRAAAGPAAEYLSDVDFPGLHILERFERGGEARLRLYPHGQKAREPGEVHAAWGTLQEARESLQAALHIPPREPYQNDWAMFDAQGRGVSSLQGLAALEVVFVIELGVWIWPPVRVGFEHVAEGVDGDTPKVLRTLSLRPVIFEVRDFIRPRECEEVKSLGQKQGLVASKGVMQSADLEKGTADRDFRTSKQAWLFNQQSKAVKRLDRRTANLTRVPWSHNEPVQVLRYDEGNYYHGHMDWAELELYNDQEQLWLTHHYGHQDRLATLFWYLNDVPDGGETIFLKQGQAICPTYEQRNCPGAPDPDMTSCTKGGLKVPPTKGTVILWYNYHPSGRGDRNALHMGCPVGQGLVKWSGNKWIQIKPFNTAPARWVDDHPALKRMKWKGTKTKKVSGEQCRIDFANEGQEVIDVIWRNPSTGQSQTLLSLSHGEKSSLDTMRSHEFTVQHRGGTQKSNAVRCRQSSGSYVVDARLGIAWRGEEL